MQKIVLIIAVVLFLLAAFVISKIDYNAEDTNELSGEVDYSTVEIIEGDTIYRECSIDTVF